MVSEAGRAQANPSAQQGPSAEEASSPQPASSPGHSPLPAQAPSPGQAPSAGQAVSSGQALSPAQALSPEQALSGTQTLAGALACELAVVGCGDRSRADDGAGPALIRQLREEGVPPAVRLVDGCAAGVDVAKRLRGAKRVIVVDACTTGAAPGTVFRVPGAEVEDMPPLSGLLTYSFRWDHALALARWLLGDQYPSDVTVYLVEAGDRTPGGKLSQQAREGINQVLGLIRRERAFRITER
jgi:hydrogenase maturation protease